jgi:hypothetical protein
MDLDSNIDIDARLGEIAQLQQRNSSFYRISISAGIILYVALFIAAFENHRILAICVTFCIILCLRFVVQARDLRIEERILRAMKQLAK